MCVCVSECVWEGAAVSGWVCVCERCAWVWIDRRGWDEWAQLDHGSNHQPHEEEERSTTTHQTIGDQSIQRYVAHRIRNKTWKKERKNKQERVPWERNVDWTWMAPCPTQNYNRRFHNTRAWMRWIETKPQHSRRKHGTNRRWKR